MTNPFHARQAGDFCVLTRILWLIHRLTYRQHESITNIHVRGYKEEADDHDARFDMTVLNDLDRYHLTMDVIDRLPQLGGRAAYLKQFLRDKLADHKNWIFGERTGRAMPEVRDWKWS